MCKQRCGFSQKRFFNKPDIFEQRNLEYVAPKFIKWTSFSIQRCLLSVSFNLGGAFTSEIFCLQNILHLRPISLAGVVVAAAPRDAARRNHQSWSKAKTGHSLIWRQSGRFMEKLNHNKYHKFWSNLSKRENHPTSPPNNSNSSFYKSLTMDFFRKMAEAIPAPLPRTTRKNSCDSVIQMTFWKLLRFLLFFLDQML